MRLGRRAAGEPAQFADAAEDAGEQAGLAQDRHRIDGAGRQQQLQELGAHPLPREPVEAVAGGDGGGESLRIRCAAPVAGVEAEETQQPQGIFAQAGRRVADEAHPAGGEVGDTPGRVVQASLRVEREGVDGEVAPLGIASEVAAETHHRVSPVGLHVLAQGRHLVRLAADDEGDGPVLDPRAHRLDPGGAGAGHHGLGPQRGGKVDVGDDGAQQRVAHAATDETRFLARRIERREAGLHARPRQEAGRAVRDQRRGNG